MAAELTGEQRRVNNSDEFVRLFSTLNQAAIGVTLLRTREPYRAVDSLREFAFSEQLDFKVWNILYGWSTYDRQDPEANPTVDNLTDPNAALRAINGIGGGQAFSNGVYAMMYPHFMLSKAPPMIAAVKEYAKSLPETKKRLVLVSPLGYSLPPELEDDVVIIDFDPPSFSELSDIMNGLLQDIDKSKRPTLSGEDRDRLLSAMAGMTAHEAENALSRALIENRTKLPSVPVDDLAEVILKVKTEIIKRSEVLELMDTEGMDSVGGLDNLKDWAQKRSHCFGDAAREFGIDRLKGVALIGPPGTGKSLASKAMASMLGLPLIKFDISRVFQSLVGQSEERVRAATKTLDAMAPCVVLIDEVDKALSTNSGGDSGVGKRVLGVLLTWMQETKAPVFVVCTANRVDTLPSEFLRRGRLDEVFSVSLPSEEERREIFQIHLRKRRQDPDSIEGLESAVERSNGYCGSELEAAVKDALVEAFVSEKPVTGDLIVEQLGNMVPLSEAFAEQFHEMEEWASNNARPANSGAQKRPRARQRSRPSAGPAQGGRRQVSLDSD